MLDTVSIRKSADSGRSSDLSKPGREGIGSSKRRIDFATRASVLSGLQARKGRSDIPVDGAGIADQLAWARDALAAHAVTLSARGIPVAHVYAAAAAVSVDRAIAAIGAAERQEGWSLRRGIEDFGSGGLAEWL